MLCFYPRPLFGANYVLRPALKFTFKEFCHGSSEGCIAVAAVITMNIYLLKSSLAVLGLCPRQCEFASLTALPRLKTKSTEQASR